MMNTPSFSSRISLVFVIGIKVFQNKKERRGGDFHQIFHVLWLLSFKESNRVAKRRVTERSECDPLSLLISLEKKCFELPCPEGQ